MIAGWSLGDMVTDERLKAPDEELLDHDILKHAMGLLDELDERDATVLKLRFGLDGSEPLTLKEIGAKLGLTANEFVRLKPKRFDDWRWLDRPP